MSIVSKKSRPVGAELEFSPKLKLLIFLSILSAGTLVISNLSAVKLWDFFGLAVDGGIMIFPLSYVLGDLIMEIFGLKTSRTIIFASFFLNLLAVLVLTGVSLLPPHPGWEHQSAFALIHGFAPRIVAGSLVAYLASQLLNNLIFARIKRATGERRLYLRTIGSSLIARLVDLLIFETIAFLGILPFSDFVGQVVLAYFAGFALELVLTPLTYLAVKGAKRYVG